jgi:hypothetical protein
LILTGRARDALRDCEKKDCDCGRAFLGEWRPTRCAHLIGDTRGRFARIAGADVQEEG